MKSLSSQTGLAGMGEGMGKGEEGTLIDLLGFEYVYTFKSSVRPVNSIN